MEEKKSSHLTHLKQQLKLKEFQFNSIYEFSESIYSAFEVEAIIRIYFSTLMGQLGIPRMFFYDSGHHLFHRRGFKTDESEEQLLGQNLLKLGSQWFVIKTQELSPEFSELQAFLLEKKIFHLLNISEIEDRAIVLGLGEKLNNKELTNENIDYTFLVSKFSASAVENAILINKMIENKRMEHEVKIARDIQLSLLPQSIPVLENFEIAVRYEPIHEVGGDYYDILEKRKNGELPLVIADVEGKGLSAALLAASSQAVFRTLNEIYFFDVNKFVAKANHLIYDFTRGNRFITLFWMLLDDQKRSIRYVNAGHIEPIFISGNRVRRLDKGGFLTGFVDSTVYDSETIQFQPGDMIAAFTDGVPEVENKAGEEFGTDAITEFLRQNKHLSAKELVESFYDTILEFSQKKKFRDDFTFILLKAR